MLHILAGSLRVRTSQSPLSWAGKERGLLAGGCMLMAGPLGALSGYNEATHEFSFWLVLSVTPYKCLLST